MLLEQSQKAKIVSLIFLFSSLINHVSAEEEEEHAVDPTSGEFWGQIIAILGLVVLSGIVAGLTLGLMSLDTTNLSILKLAGTPQQQYYASRIIPIRKNGHILLATLLLTNTVINETLPILFDSIFSKGFISVIVSTALLVLFAEIIPQAIFSKHGLKIGAMFAVPVKVLIGIWFIISWPIAKFLDHLLGTHTGFTYNIPELGALVELHDETKHDEGVLKHETVNFVQNVLSMQIRPVSQFVSPTSNMLMLPSDTVVSFEKASQYIRDGYSHIYVYVKDTKEQITQAQDDYQIQGVLDLKQFIVMQGQDLTEPIGNMKLNSFLTSSSRTTMIEVMSQLLKDKSKSQVMLIYRTEGDVRKNGEERAEKAREAASIKEAALKKHKKSISCMMKQLFSRRCHVCYSFSNSQFVSTASMDQRIEEGTIHSTSSVPTTIDAELELGLLGVITAADILSQLSSHGPHLNFSHHENEVTEK
ncbi:uncharacterized protein B0P05DRAFT_529209 [Gilbertella persicaria]|uniref:uncharacterized protein n=1 Tax=Gilbertella persicaria TaxID=101096 RepID=UPI0022200BBC|nr:uncharacterized protein B0P05DRAFT_529209 [Gilbertella persicaria]KAI8090068.1 hypothetical protein B0P05DRAFT_529209 [Gilbertella persicaria]